jgi:putative Mg2+ transporter-C (MgtC) family protein
LFAKAEEKSTKNIHILLFIKVREMVLELSKGFEVDFLLDVGLSLIAGFLIGIEREYKDKPAGISTHSFVIGGSMIFTYLSSIVEPNLTSRIAAEIVAGVGFLGAGVILKGEAEHRITNLTTAASIWFSAAIGMTIGFGFYIVAVVAIMYATLVPWLPHISKIKRYLKKA